nr:beta-ketoacyl synthase N-terminal-like domain-containing protein [Micromonospora sp. DSM 115978]
MISDATAITVTGLGLVTGYGYGVDRFWAGLLAGRTAVGPAGRFGGTEGESVGEVPDPPGGSGSRLAYADAAVAEALAGAGYRRLPDGCLVIVVGQTPDLVGPGRQSSADVVNPTPTTVGGGRVAGGGPYFLTHACASAAFAVGLARDMMAGGVADVALVVGATVLNHTEYASMRAVRAVSSGRARPFDRTRDGITLGEGAGALLLETAGRAAGRGVRADVEVAAVDCRVSGAKAAASDQEVVTGCLTRALAGSGADRVDYAQAHATGTVQGDAVELAALETLAGRLGGPPIPVSSHKGAIGHLLHASCFPAIVAATLALRTGTLPPTPGLADPEPTDRVRLLRVPEPAPRPRHALVVSAGFGGNNAALALSRR